MHKAAWWLWHDHFVTFANRVEREGKDPGPGSSGYLGGDEFPAAGCRTA